jgi:hypothetical protein
MADGPELIAKISAASRAGEAAAAEHLEALEAIADESLLPDLLAALEDDDPGGSLWSLFYLAENMDDAYLAALLDALPGLHERAPHWAETAVIRILNTRGEPEDCTGTFLHMAGERTKTLRRLLVRILQAVAREPDELAPGQAEIIAETIAALEGV